MLAKLFLICLYWFPLSVIVGLIVGNTVSFQERRAASLEADAAATVYNGPEDEELLAHERM
jgi:hypothetical protein